ncbi:MAG: histidine kinase [Ignavibacteria bacterium]|nr:histidine kinase [Ignavibacteria bacterium]
MKKLLLGLLLILSVAIVAQTHKVTFIVTLAKIQPGEKVYIAGNLPQIGSWQPDAIVLDSIAPGKFSLSVDVPVQTTLLYKFTRGSWAHEAMYEAGKVPDNFKLQPVHDTIVNYTVVAWKEGSNNTTVTGKVTGTVQYHRKMHFDGIRDRDVIVWLPPGYDQCNAFYPVLYMHDGQNIIDPATSSFGHDWCVDETADSLIRAGKVRPIIIVGIYNTIARSYDYSPCDTSAAYMKFIVTKLKPFIDKTYRTLPEQKYTATAGSSLGGLIAFMLAWEYPNVFSKAGCFSPAFSIETIDYVAPVQKAKQKKNVQFYFDMGGVDLEAALQPGLDKMLSALQKLGYKQGKDYIMIKDEKAVHTEEAWAKRFHYMLEFFYHK